MLKRLSEMEKETALRPDEVRAVLEGLKRFVASKESDDIAIVFPAGFKIQDTEVGGFRVTDVFQNMIDSLENYEPPIMREEAAGEEVVEEGGQLPEWLRAHQDLVWKGTAVNPLWEVEAVSYEDQVKINYVRGNKRLRPGKTTMEQGRTLKDVRHVFDRKEWRVIEPVISQFQQMEKQLRSGVEDVSKEARKKLLAVLREENQFRHGRMENPVIIKKLLKESLEKVARQGRWSIPTRTVLEENLNELTGATAEILSQVMVLNITRNSGKEYVPKVDPAIKEIPTFANGLENLLTCFDYQMKGQGDQPKGFSLLLGEPGTGKNELVKYAAAKLDRPFFWFPCGRGMEAQDLAHHYEFDTKEGTKKFFTSLAEGLQTPGAIVFIDEANALKPQVQAILHGLGDSNRRMSYDGIDIPAAEGVIVILGGNPATQGSAGNFGEPILSRSRGQAMVLDYPSLTKADYLKKTEKLSDAEMLTKETEDNSLQEYFCDEALALYHILDEFKDLNGLEFEYVWERVINEKDVIIDEKFESLNTVKLNELITLGGPALVKRLTDLRDIMRIADLWRKKFEKRELPIGVSMRDTLALVTAYKRIGDVRQSFLRLFDDFRKNPIEGLDVVYVEMLEMVDTILQPTTT